MYKTIYFYFSLFKILLSAYFKIVFHKYDWETYVNYSKKIIDLVTTCGARVHIDGEQELLKVKPPVIIVSNHMSSLETFIFGYIFGRFFKITFIAKKSLVYYPIFGRIFKYLNPILITRKNPAEDYRTVLNQSRELFENKISLVVFPQATRSVQITEEKFSSIATKLAKHFKLDLLPVCVKTNFLAVGKILKDFGKVQPWEDVFVKILPLIRFCDINKETNKQLVLLLKNTLTEFYKKSSITV